MRTVADELRSMWWVDLLAPETITKLANGVESGDFVSAHMVLLMAGGLTREPPTWWWQTVLGMAVVRVFVDVGHLPNGLPLSWSHAEAARVLGVQKGTVSKLVHAGYLETDDHGSPLRLEVLARLLRLHKVGPVSVHP